MNVPPGALRALRSAVLLLSASLVAFFVYAVSQRVRFPVELEWMSGAVLDTVERVVQGRPIYAAPSVDWVPFLYPPLYYWTSAALAHVVSLAMACRIVSITATVVAAVLVGRMSRVLGASWFWSAVAIGCFFGCYSLTDYWYDIERADSLCVALLLAGVLVALESRRTLGAAISGVLLGFAFFAKQPALLVCAGTCGGLAASGQWRRAAVATLGAASVILPLGAWLHITTDGWWDYYCLALGAKHGIDPALFTVFFVLDQSKAFLLSAASFTFFGWLARDLVMRARSRTPVAAQPVLVVFGSALAAAFVSSAASRLHIGGWPNVLVFWTSLACVAVAVVATRVEAAARPTAMGTPIAAGLALAALLQLGHLAYDPTEACPDRQRVVEASTLEAKVRELEKEGEVVLTGRGHMTEHRHFHQAAMNDVIRGGDGIPADFLRGLDERRFAAYVVDEWGELTLEGILGGRQSELFDHVVASYYVAERFDDRARPPIVGWPGHPSWVMRPRKNPLVGQSTPQLEARWRIETGFAELHMREAQAGAQVASAATNEDLAEAALRDAEAARVSK